MWWAHHQSLKNQIEVHVYMLYSIIKVAAVRAFVFDEKFKLIKRPSCVSKILIFPSDLARYKSGGDSERRFQLA